MHHDAHLSDRVRARHGTGRASDLPGEEPNLNGPRRAARGDHEDAVVEGSRGRLGSERRPHDVIPPPDQPAQGQAAPQRPLFHGLPEQGAQAGIGRSRPGGRRPVHGRFPITSV
jgi:hypothetical protein